MSDKSLTVTKRGRPPIGEQAVECCGAQARPADARQPAAIDAIGDEQNAPLRALLAILGRVEASESSSTFCATRLGRNRPAVWFRECHK
jgi:hypothetical protein